MIKFLRIVSFLLLLFIAVMVFMFMPVSLALTVVALYIVYAILSSKSRMDTSSIQEALVDLLDAFKDDWNKPVGKMLSNSEIQSLEQMVMASLMMDPIRMRRANATEDKPKEDTITNKPENGSDTDIDKKPEDIDTDTTHGQISDESATVTSENEDKVKEAEKVTE